MAIIMTKLMRGVANLFIGQFLPLENAEQPVGKKIVD